MTDMRLTVRERQVLTLLGDGRTTEEAAEDLAISADVAEVHLRNARAKLGANTTIHAVVIALSAGAIELWPREPLGRTD